LAGTRWDAIHSWPSVLIDNAQERASRIRRSLSLLTGFSPHQNSKGKNGCNPKSQPYYIRCFHNVDPLLRVFVPDFLSKSQVKLLRLGMGDIAQGPMKKASRIFGRTKKTFDLSLNSD